MSCEDYSKITSRFERCFEENPHYVKRRGKWEIKKKIRKCSK